MPYRTYTSPGGQVVNGVAYLYDATLVVGDITGNFRPAFTSDFAANINVSGLNLSVGSVAVTGGSVAISNTTPIPVSGVVVTSATFDSSSIVNAQVTGNNYTLISNSLLSGISGLLRGPVAVSGVVQTNATFDSTSIVNAQASGNNDTTVSNRLLSGISGLLRGPVAISGVVQTTATISNIAVTGGSINIANTAPIAISGVVVTNAAITGGTFTFDPTAIVDAQVSGNILLSGISGLLSSNLSDPAWVTGQVSLSNTAPIAISGVVVTNATFDSTSIVNAQVSGNNDTTVSNRLLSGISGLLRGPVAISGVVQTSATFDSSSIVNAQASGNNLTTISNALLSGVSGLLTTSIVSPAWVTGQLVLTTPASTATGATNPALSGLSTPAWGVALQANTDRKAWGIQNLSTGIIRFNFSITPPSSTACHVVLRGGSSLGDGLGASFFDPKPAYTGPISVSGDFSSSGAYSIWEIRS
jgi:hypothetical protein